MRTKTVLAGIAGTAAAGAVAARAAMRRSDENGATAPHTRMLQRQLNDMIALNTKVLSDVRRQLDSFEIEDVPMVRETLEEVDRTIDAHLVRLEAEHEALGGEGGSAMKAIAGGVMGATSGMVERFRSEPVSRMYRDDYASLSLVAISYTMLHTTALTLGNTSLADTAQLCLEQTTPLVVRINDEMPHVVVAELEKEGLPTQPEAAPEAEQDTQAAWQQGAQQEHQGF